MPMPQNEMCNSFPDFALFPHLTVKSNISFGLEANKSWHSSEIRELSQILMRRFGLENCANKHPNELSGGQTSKSCASRL